MPSWIFFNIPPNPDIVLDYKAGYAALNVSARVDDNPLPLLLFEADNSENVFRKLKSASGLEIELPDNGKIYLRLRRFMLKRRLKVLCNDIELSGLRIS
ncbi:MAG: hypothetical protein CVU11_02465 [Bacteroidetes bacterium HGW-Bacteroidetes-6]|jgi:hypothetical protein|nr:MAG: hypothetical protein CVU11_02465 [Bacteroidetes bacterium HGW-Bacteroidetes-6]